MTFYSMPFCSSLLFVLEAITVWRVLSVIVVRLDDAVAVIEPSCKGIAKRVVR